MVGIPAVSNLIREEKTYQLHSILQTNSKLGMTTFDQSVEKLVEENIITADAFKDTKAEFKKSIGNFSNVHA